MSEGRLKRAMTRLAGGSYRTKILTFATLAALTPLAALVSVYGAQGDTQPWYMPVLAIGATLVFLLGLARSLHPIDTVARALERCAGDDSAPALRDDARRLVDNVETVAARLETLNRRAGRHPLTALPLREEFLAAVNLDMSDPDAMIGLLGVIRFANYQQIGAFDLAIAERALGAFAQKLERAADKTRIIAHVDRESFAIWFSRLETHKQATAELQALAYALAQEIHEGDLAIAPDVQIGAALYPADGDDAATLLTRALVSLSSTRHGGAIVFAAPASEAEARRRFSLEQDLRQAMRRDQLSLHYQPVVDVNLGRVIGAEALLRWRHDELGAVSPAEFVPILEDTSLVHEFGLWTLNAACRQARAWRDEGLDLVIAVNLSARQLRDRALVQAIVRTIERHDLPAGALELELTETAAMEDAERTLALFRDLKALGFGLAIDDFGAGYSSLSYLTRLPFSKLKIDREFVTHADTRPTSSAICKALIELCAGLDIAVLAEGAERAEEVAQLRRLGCHTFQGFYFAPPLRAEGFAQAIAAPDFVAKLSAPPRVDRIRCANA